MIGFLHTADAHVAAFGALVEEAAPGEGHAHRVDVPLLDDARAGAPTGERIRAHVDALVAAGASVMVCTCSTLGPVAEEVGGLGVPVVRVDRPLAEAAVRDGGRVAVVVALASTLGPTTDLLADAARRAGATVELDPVVCVDAWSAFEAGDLGAYHRAVADAARDAVRRRRADVVVLAQASMAPAAALLVDLPVPVLTSPGSAVARAVELART
ncbi:aspartate/glutamate racemase family protein [Cellulosimicrobium cellulans]|uniref:aspartate/glutamate racemase family protein n=1 Tax=Cellulosimicrobium cellulans TaxID=1710 RepID=UPI002405D4CE|nr:aspartate/glutamate racemase family protein [Cellulosimicrobium cellulans]MDF9878336.1 aspartate/glutamate racemase [Cellulosimicrobium cellulans]